MSAVVVAVIAAVSSAVAAVAAGMFSLAARRLDAGLQHSQKVQGRILERNISLYEPIVELLYHMFTSDDSPTPEELEAKRRHETWLTLYGSAGVVRAYSRLMQALGCPSPPPGDIQLWLYADVLLEIRKDIGNPNGALDRAQILGPGLSDDYGRTNLTDPDLDAVCKRLKWTPPWQTS